MQQEQPTPNPQQFDPHEDARHRLERRQLIKSAIAAMPVVLTITAGTAHAQTYTYSGGGAPEALDEEGEAVTTEDLLRFGGESLDEATRRDFIDSFDGDAPPTPDAPLGDFGGQ